MRKSLVLGMGASAYFLQIMIKRWIRCFSFPCLFGGDFRWSVILCLFIVTNAQWFRCRFPLCFTSFEAFADTLGILFFYHFLCRYHPFGLARRSCIVGACQNPHTLDWACQLVPSYALRTLWKFTATSVNLTLSTSSYFIPPLAQQGAPHFSLRSLVGWRNFNSLPICLWE